MPTLRARTRRPRHGHLPAAAAVVLVALTAAAPASAAPPALPTPADLAVAPGPITAASQVTATWTAPPGLPGGTTAAWTLCPAAPDAPEEECRSGDVAEGVTTATVATPDEGSFDLTVRLRGTEDGPASAPLRIVIDRTAPKAPVDVRWDSGVVRWSDPADDGAPIVRVHWKLCGGWMGLGERCVSSHNPAEPFPLALGLIESEGRPPYCSGRQWNLRLWLEDAAGNVDLDPRNAGGTGAGVVPACVPPVGEDERETPTRTKTSLALGGRLTATGKGSKRRKRLAVTATAKPGNATGTVRIRVTGKLGKRKLTRTRSVTLKDGRANYALTVPKGFRRLSVKATYAGSTTHLPSSRTMRVELPR